MKFNFKSILVLLVMVGVLIFAVSFFYQQDTTTDEITLAELTDLFREDLVKEAVIDSSGLIKGEYYVFGEESGTLVGGTKTFSYQFGYMDDIEAIKDIALGRNGYEKPARLQNFEHIPQEETPWYILYLPYIIVGVILIVVVIIAFRSAGAAGGKINSFSKARAKVATNDGDAVKFADVAGADEEKAELEEVVEFLKDPSKFVKLGARIPRGVLLVGPPGTGKTLLAKAVAGEAGVPFFSISGSDFVEMYVGVGASRVRDLFDNARKTPASIVFIDEIDAVGRHRGAGLGGGHDEREQTLNQLLVEMDGFGTNSGVIVMAATNRPDILDPALLRPGRFDRQITVNYPDMKGREEILKVHCRNKPLEEGVDLHKIAQTTIGFTGAELANLMNEAALRAAKKGKSLVGMEDIEESYMKILLGPQKKTKARREADNKLCAYHEAGHAVASYYCENSDPVKHITIIPAGNAGGVTLSVPTEDRLGSSKNEMLDRIVLGLGGRVAEALVLDDISTGASGDIRQVTSIARNMVTRYGMSDKLGTVLYGTEHSSDEVFLGRDFSSGKNYSEKTASDIDDEIRSIIQSCYDRCEKILTEHIDKLHFVAEFLLKNEFMEEDQFLAAMQSENPTFEEIENIAKERRRKSEEENRTAEKNRKQAEAEKEREELARQAIEENRAHGIFNPATFDEIDNDDLSECIDDGDKTSSDDDSNN